MNQDPDYFKTLGQGITIGDYKPFGDVNTFVGRPQLYRWLDDVFRVGSASPSRSQSVHAVEQSQTSLNECIIREPDPGGDLVLHERFGNEDERKRLLIRALNTVDLIQAGYLVGEKVVIPNVKVYDPVTLKNIFRQALDQMQTEWNKKVAGMVGVGLFYESTIVAALHVDVKEDVHIHRLFRKMLK